MVSVDAIRTGPPARIHNYHINQSLHNSWLGVEDFPRRFRTERLGSACGNAMPFAISNHGVGTASRAGWLYSI